MNDIKEPVFLEADVECSDEKFKWPISDIQIEKHAEFTFGVNKTFEENEIEHVIIIDEIESFL